MKNNRKDDFLSASMDGPKGADDTSVTMRPLIYLDEDGVLQGRPTLSVDEMAEKMAQIDSNISKETAATAINAFSDFLMEQLKQGNDVDLFGIGKFSVVPRDENNPGAGNEVVFEESEKMSVNLKELENDLDWLNKLERSNGKKK